MLGFSKIQSSDWLSSWLNILKAKLILEQILQLISNLLLAVELGALVHEIATSIASDTHWQHHPHFHRIMVRPLARRQFARIKVRRKVLVEHFAFSHSCSSVSNVQEEISSRSSQVSDFGFVGERRRGRDLHIVICCEEVGPRETPAILDVRGRQQASTFAASTVEIACETAVKTPPLQIGQRMLLAGKDVNPFLSLSYLGSAC